MVSRIFFSSDSKFLVFPHCSNWGRRLHAVAIFVGSVIGDIEFAICKNKQKKLAEVVHSHAYEASVQTMLV